MASKSGTLGRIASKTLEASREHVGKLMSGAETLAQAAGGAVEDLLSGTQAKSTKTAAVRKVSAKKRAVIKKKKRAKRSSTSKKSKSK
jgi:hypothetical protein